MNNKNKDKDIILKLTLSVLLVVFGIILLLDQLNVKFVDDLFTPWYTIVILFFAACIFAYAVIKKAPICYVLSMLFAGIFLVISIDSKVEQLSVSKIIVLVPMFVGLGFILADRICKWSPRILWFGIVLTVASTIVLVSTILDVWKYVIPIVLVLVGISYIIFELLTLRQKIVEKPVDHYVTYQESDSRKETAEAENKQESEENKE